jgi:LysW-gamma-L-lysine carboxypeptidase
MHEIGFERAFNDEAGNAVGIIGDGPRQIVLLGHIDTVPGEIPVRVEGERLYGRGAVDAKGPLAAFTDAAARAGAPPGWQIVVIGAVDEERDSMGARYVVARYRPDYAIIGEPSSWERVTLGYKGSAWARVRVRKPLTHTAALEESAPECAVRLWERLRAWGQAFNREHERVFEQLTLTLRGMASGNDGFEEWAELQLGARLPPGTSPDDCYTLLEEQIGAFQFAETAAVDFDRIGYPIQAYRAEKNTPLVSAFLASVRAAGEKPGFVVKSGTADLNIVAPNWDCPAVAYGPGDSNLDHTPDEHIELKEYEKSVDVLARVLAKLTASPPES